MGGGWLGSPGRRLAQAVRLATDPVGFVRAVRVMRLAGRHGTAHCSTINCVKYLGTYLARGLTAGQRRRAIACHHRLLAAVVGRDAIWPAELPVWRGDGAAADLAVVLRPARLAPMEGEHELALFFQGEQIYTLTFVLVEGAVLGIAAAVVMAIGGVQGGYAMCDRIRAAAKANGEVAPATMLLIAARAFAAALGVMTLVGVGSCRQAAGAYAADAIRQNYDRLWAEFGAQRDAQGWHRVHPGCPARPLAEVERSHRARTRRKRALKEHLFNEVLVTIQAVLHALPRDRAVAVRAASPAMGGIRRPVAAAHR